jgi:hypothetical protein
MYQFLNLIFLFVGNPIMPEIRSTTGNKCSFIGSNTFIGIDEYNSNYICRNDEYNSNYICCYLNR